MGPSLLIVLGAVGLTALWMILRWLRRGARVLVGLRSYLEERGFDDLSSDFYGNAVVIINTQSMPHMPQHLTKPDALLQCYEDIALLCEMYAESEDMGDTFIKSKMVTDMPIEQHPHYRLFHDHFPIKQGEIDDDG